MIVRLVLLLGVLWCLAVWTEVKFTQYYAWKTF